MKRLVVIFMFAGALLIGMNRPAHSETDWTYRNWFTIHLPLADASLVALYDFVADDMVVGAETKVISFPKAKGLSLTFGGVVDPESKPLGVKYDFLEKSSPFIGTRYDLPTNFIPDFLLPDIIENNIHIGLAYGRHLDEGENIVGIKFNVDLIKR